MRKGIEISAIVAGGIVGLLFAHWLGMDRVIGTGWDNIVWLVTPHDADNVTVFNDGFYESKHDDCEQGFQAACEWLKAAN
ncbi:hypothetical protein [Streptomyces sp. CBMA123]|uniref:hypothetical protein n=1 Tax=Streptomyces sp. CBMA123 TaxID=1896313 RepID=UPI001661F4EB|nr:hypothetical protein [Streptomyces sp. CBMA123]MBD0689628.1 hypothetical protein [Streptomyces sp. CBMA123]